MDPLNTRTPPSQSPSLVISVSSFKHIILYISIYKKPRLGFFDTCTGSPSYYGILLVKSSRNFIPSFITHSWMTVQRTYLGFIFHRYIFPSFIILQSDSPLCLEQGWYPLTIGLMVCRNIIDTLFDEDRDKWSTILVKVSKLYMIHRTGIGCVMYDSSCYVLQRSCNFVQTLGQKLKSPCEDVLPYEGRWVLFGFVCLFVCTLQE